MKATTHRIAVVLLLGTLWSTREGNALSSTHQPYSVFTQAVEASGTAQQRIASSLRAVLQMVNDIGLAAARAKTAPTIRLSPEGNVEVYIYMHRPTQENLHELEQYEVRTLRFNQEAGVLYAILPLRNLEVVAVLPFVHWICPPAYGTLQTGSVTSMGDAVMRANVARSRLGVDGRGVRVGVISDSLEDLQASVATGDLPANLTIVNGQAGDGADEGRAMSEIIYDLAPGAQLLFHTGLPTSLDMVEAVRALVAAGSHVIVDDVEFFDEPVFQEGLLSQAVQQAVDTGVLYVTAAGNNATKHYRGVYTEFNPGDGNPSVNLHDFGGGATTLSVDIFPFQSLSVFLQWPNLFDGSANTADYDLFLVTPDGKTDACALKNDDGSPLLTGTCSSTDRQLGGNAPPLERIDVQSSSFNTVTVAVTINRVGGEDLPLALLFNGAVELKSYNVAAGSIFGHPCVRDVLTVGAIAADDYKVTGIENFSSQGPCALFFPTREQRAKPDVGAADGVNTSLEDFSPFFGTSAAAPHAAAVAAMLVQATGGPGVLSNRKIVDLMQKTAVDLGEPGSDNITGFGAVDALQTVRDGTILAGGGFGVFWLGLKKADNEGTLFDLRVEVYRDTTLVAAGESFCIEGITKPRAQAKEVMVRLEPTPEGNVALPSGPLVLKVLTRLGTSPHNGILCQGPQGNRDSASGLRLYYDGKARPSRFSAGVLPAPFQEYFLHTNDKNFFDTTAPSIEQEQFKASGRLNLKRGNHWRTIGIWFFASS